ncbi:peptide deformylase [Patescibacteria group bacterium]|nr:peptide deformylase [Patescibacteria group bacterium]
MAPNEILRQATKPVNPAMAGLAKIIEEMKHVLVSQKDPEGVGLAANQVGLPYRLFLARFDTKKSSPVYTFINPEIVDHSEQFQPEDKKAPLEGCLSVPKYYGVVKRYQWLVVKYQNEKFEMKNEKFSGFPATVIQHEMDHLNGKIFVERILEQNGRLYKTNGKDKKGKEEWEEVEL